MKKIYVFPNDHFLARPPLLSSAVLYMALDMYSAPGWVWGVSLTLMTLAWIGYVCVALKQSTKPLAGYGKHDE